MSDGFCELSVDWARNFDYVKTKSEERSIKWVLAKKMRREIFKMRRWRSQLRSEIIKMRRWRSKPRSEIIKMRRWRSQLRSEIIKMRRCRSQLRSEIIKMRWWGAHIVFWGHIPLRAFHNRRFWKCCLGFRENKRSHRGPIAARPQPKKLRS